MDQPDLFRIPRKPWNAGRMTGAEAPLKPEHIWAIRQHLKSLGSVRDLAIFNTALDAELRGCDLVKTASCRCRPWRRHSSALHNRPAEDRAIRTI